MILYVMYENAMSILKLGASLEGLLGLEGSMTWTVTQKLGAQASHSLHHPLHHPLYDPLHDPLHHPLHYPLQLPIRYPSRAQASHSFDLQKMLKNIAIFPRELITSVFLVGAGIYGLHVGTSWVFTVYFCTQAPAARPCSPLWYCTTPRGHTRGRHVTAHPQHCRHPHAPSPACAQGLLFFIFALSLVEAFNLQPPPEAQLLGLAPKPAEVEMQPVKEPKKSKKSKKKKKAREKRKGGAKYASVAAEDSDESSEESDEVCNDM